MIPDLKQRALASQFADMPKSLQTEDRQIPPVSPLKNCHQDQEDLEEERQMYTKSKQHLISDAGSGLLFLDEKQSFLCKYANRRPKRMVPDDRKDQHYWQRRQKNNDAARKSRDLKRKKENDVRHDLAELQQYNTMLQEELQVLKKAFSLSEGKRYIGINKDGGLVCIPLYQHEDYAVSEHCGHRYQPTPFSHKETVQMQAGDYTRRQLNNQACFDQDNDSQNINSHEGDPSGPVAGSSSVNTHNYSMNFSDGQGNHKFYLESPESGQNSMDSCCGSVTSGSELSYETDLSPSFPLQKDRSSGLDHPLYRNSINTKKNVETVQIGQYKHAASNHYFNNPYWQTKNNTIQDQKTNGFPEEMLIRYGRHIPCGSRQVIDTNSGGTVLRMVCGKNEGQLFQNKASDIGEQPYLIHKGTSVFKSGVNMTTSRNKVLLSDYCHQLKCPDTSKLLGVVGLTNRGVEFKKFKYSA